MSPRTAAATEAAQRNAAIRSVEHPVRRARAIRAVGAGLASGAITVDDLAVEALRVAESAPAPDREQIERLRALLPAVDRPSRTEAAAA